MGVCVCVWGGGVFNSEAFGKIIFHLYQRFQNGNVDDAKRQELMRLIDDNPIRYLKVPYRVVINHSHKFLPLRIIYLAVFRSTSLPTSHIYQYASSWQHRDVECLMSSAFVTAI